MICRQLIGTASLTERALIIGARMDEFLNRSGTTNDELEKFKTGKAEVIYDFLEGGNGFIDARTSISFNAGARIEREDYRSFLRWNNSLDHCINDHRMGKVN